MSLGDAYQEDVDRALDAQARLAPDPVMPKPRGLWRTAADSLLGAGAKLQASALEVGNVIGPALALSADPSNADALEAVKHAPDFRQTEQSKPFRDFERKLRPDPVTASKAEEVVYGATGAMATLVGATVLGGIPGLAAAAGEQGFSTAEDLAQQGVDLKTRTGVGALTAGVTGVSALLPMAGPTVKATVGLYLAGGPGGFIAQQYATRKILEAADYGEIAKQYDPLDPTGLLVSSLIPAPFAAWGIRGNLKARKGAPAPAGEVKPTAEPAPTVQAQPQDVVDAAMAHNLTLQRDVHEATPAARVAAETMRPVVTETPAFREWFGESAIRTADGAPMVAYHGTGSDFESFSADALGSNTGVADAREGFFFTSSGRDASEYAWKDGQPGQVMPVYLSIKNPFVTDFVVTAANNREFAQIIKQAKDAGHDGVAAFLDTFGRESSVFVAFRPEQIKSAIGNSGLFDPASPSLTDPMPQVTRTAPTEPAQVTKAKEAAQALQDSGKPLADFAAGAKLEPDVQNLLIGLSEAGKDAQRAARMLNDFTRAVEAQPGRKPVDIAADVVEASREGRTVTPEPQKAQASAGTPEKATAESIQNRIAELEAAAPDMVVRMSDDGKPVTLADEMARIRREAAEGTDSELGTNDTGLLKVAAECAMSVGQV